MKTKLPLIITTILLSINLLHATSDIETVTTKDNVWNAAKVQVKAGETCDDGNCLSDVKCFTKEGPAYRVFNSVRKRFRKLCKI